MTTFRRERPALPAWQPEGVGDWSYWVDDLQVTQDEYVAAVQNATERKTMETNEPNETNIERVEGDVNVEQQDDAGQENEGQDQGQQDGGDSEGSE